MIDDKAIRFGKYLLVERIGVGGMAEVFRAKTFGAEGFERQVAIKRILPHLVEDGDFVKMFIDEAKIAVQLNHPNIVAIHDLGRAEGTLFIAMEFVPGRDLRAIYDFEEKRGSHTSIGLACHIVMKMCEALHHAHFANGPRGEPLQVIHRDVSPQNVLLSFDGEVKVADFGLAKARGRMVQTQAGVVKGKLAYMSPEQLRGDPIDHRVDVFGLGIVLFELLTGKRLFLGPSDMDTLRRVYEAKVPPMREMDPQIPEELETIVRRTLAKDREQRYPTALELHDDLQTFAYSHGVYRGASALRQYLREAFPDLAPEPEELPPFTSSAPPPGVPAMPTFRPPARGRHPSDEVPPPPPQQGSSVEVELEPSFAPPMPQLVAAPPPPPPVDGWQDEDLPTERPPMAEIQAAIKAALPAVVAQRVVHTGRPPAPPSESGTVPVSSRELPSHPVGLYDENLGTEEADPALFPLARKGENRPDESAAFADLGWANDDEDTTAHGGTPPLTPGNNEQESWEDDSTVVADPETQTG